MKRRPDWRQRFEAAVDEIKSRPFQWGEHDCGPGLVGRLVFAVAGEDLAAPYRGRYTTARGAVHVMRRAGYANLGDMVASMLPEIHPSRAKIGDIVAFPMEGEFGFALGVVNGSSVFVLRPEGIGTMDLLRSTRAFAVG